MKRKSRRFMDLPDRDLRSTTPLVSGTLYVAPATDLDPYLPSLGAVSR